MDSALRNQIRDRAGNRCEYCLMPQVCVKNPHHIDHVIAVQHRGRTILENLALACAECNAFKGPNLSGMDPETD